MLLYCNIFCWPLFLVLHWEKVDDKEYPLWPIRYLNHALILPFAVFEQTRQFKNQKKLEIIMGTLNSLFLWKSKKQKGKEQANNYGLKFWFQ